jgi:hypothetical protein
VKSAADVFPDKPTDLWMWYGEVGAGRGLQKLLVAEVENERATRLLQDSQGDPRTVARLTGAQSKLAGVWLTTLPVSKDQTLSDNHFSGWGYCLKMIFLGYAPARLCSSKILCTSSHARD